LKKNIHKQILEIKKALKIPYKLVSCENKLFNKSTNLLRFCLCVGTGLLVGLAARLCCIHVPTKDVLLSTPAVSLSCDLR